MGAQKILVNQESLFLKTSMTASSCYELKTEAAIGGGKTQAVQRLH